MMDPILTPLFVSGLLAVGVSAGTAAIVAPILTSFVLAAAAIGLYLLFAPALPKPEDGKIAVQSTVPPRGYAYGTVRLSGSLMMRETSGGGDNLFHNAALVSHRVAAFVNIYLNDDKCEFDDDAPFPSNPDGEFVKGQGDGRYGEDRVVIAVRYGVVPETWMAMFATYGVLGGLWNSTCRGDGIAQLGMVCRDAGSDDQQKRFPYGAPNPSAVCDTALVFDPRDGAQDPDNESTWVFSRNPALAIMHYLCFSEFGFGYSYARAIAPVVAEWIIEANICDENVAISSENGGGHQNRYELGGFASTDNDPKQILQAMLAACDGWLVRRGDGTIILRVGKFRASGVVLTDDDVMGFHYQNGLADEDTVNRLDCQFTSPDHDYTQVEALPWIDDADQTARGKIRETSYNLEWVQHWIRARRITKIEFNRLREPVRGSLDLKLSGINAAYERWIYSQITKVPALNNVYLENRAARFDLQGAGLKLDFLRTGPDIYDWDSSFEEEGPPPPDVDIVHDGIINASDVVATISGAGKLVLTFAPTGGGGIGAPDHAMRWRTKDIDPGTAGDQPGPWIEERHNENPIIIAGPPVRWQLISRDSVATGVTLECQLAVILTGGSKGDWSTPPAEVNT